MRKMMFLALVLSAMAIGSVSANDGNRRPGGAMFGVGGKDGFVMVSVGGPRAPHHPEAFRGGCDCDKKCRKGNHRGCKHNDKRDKRAKKGGKPHHPSMHRPGPHNPMPHRPGMPVPPPRHK